MLRFRLCGVPFVVAPFFWVGSAIFGAKAAHGDDAFLLLAVWVLCVFVSIVLHELGHALAARKVGVEPHVLLYQFGGLTYLPGSGTLSRPRRIFVSLAGPAAGFLTLLGVLASRYALATTGAGDWVESGPVASLVTHEAIKDLVYTNGFWTAVNLLPILPLDGGQVLRDVLGPRLRVVTQGVGAGCAVACAVVAFRSGLPILALFLGYMAYNNLRGNARALPGGMGQG